MKHDCCFGCGLTVCVRQFDKTGIVGAGIQCRKSRVILVVVQLTSNLHWPLGQSGNCRGEICGQEICHHEMPAMNWQAGNWQPINWQRKNWQSEKWRPKHWQAGNRKYDIGIQDMAIKTLATRGLDKKLATKILEIINWQG